MSKRKMAMARVRNAGREAAADKNAMIALALTAAGIGWLKKSGRMASIPTFGNVPRTLILAGVGKAVEYGTSGKSKQFARGAANAALAVAISEFASGQAVSGHVAGGLVAGTRTSGLERERRLAQRLAGRAHAALSADGQLEDELSQLEGEMAGVG